ATCRVEPPLDHAQGTLTLGDAASPPYEAVPVEIVDGALQAPPARRLGAGVLTIEGYAPVRILWSGSAQGCAPDPIHLVPGDAWITGRVRHGEHQPEGRVWVEGCGTRVPVDEDGAYAMSVLAGEPCTVDAFRSDGRLLVSAGPASVTPLAGQEVVLDFTLPEAAQGGLGVTIRAADDGMHVLNVMPGSAAAELGLAPGDVLVEVDGTLVAGMDIRSFVDLATGPAGTDVDVVVDRDGERERLTLDRRLLQ
ncbi:MAG: PDZ domain-containing protein, partial [Myxococcota bacterium]